MITADTITGEQIRELRRLVVNDPYVRSMETDRVCHLVWLALDDGKLPHRIIREARADYGVNTAIGLTEREPLKCHVYGAELELTARSLRDDDPRWTTWEAHARRVIAEHAASADFTGTRRTP